MLKRYDGEAVFSKEAKWIAADGGTSGEWFGAECRFDNDESDAGDRVLLISAADGAEIYINGTLAHRSVVRSYKFDPAYEALDLSGHIKGGENVMTVLFRDTGDASFNGVIFELIIGKKRLCSGGTDMPTCFMREERLSPGPGFMIRNGAGYERYDAGKQRFGRKCGVRIIGNILHDPVEDMHRTRLCPLTEKTVLPQRITLRERWEERRGRAFSLSSDGYVDAVHFSQISAADDTSVTLWRFDDSEVTLDGEALCDGAPTGICKGVHTVAAAGSAPTFFIETDADVSDFSYAKFSDEKAAARHYPWNDPKPSCLMSEAAKSALRGDIVNDIQLYKSAEKQFPEEYLPHLKKPLSARDGKTPEAFVRAPRGHIDEVGIEEADGSVHILPSRYGAAVTFDFGHEQVGYFSLSVKSPAGTAFDVHLYESENGRGERYVGTKNRIVYTSSGKAENYVSHCRRGFRYAKIFTSASDAPIDISVSVQSTVYPTEDFDFSCSDKALETVYRSALDTARVCMLDRYVDCPGYEQNVWVGDARITALVNLTNAGAYVLNGEYLKLIAESLSDLLTKYYRTGNRRYVERLALPCAAFPTYPDGNIPIWSFLWILSVCDHYLYTGDADTARLCLPAVEETFARVERQTSPRGLFAPDGAWNLIEWANNDLSEYGEVTANNMMLHGCYTNVSQLENALGKPEKAKEYREKAEELKRRINQYCYDEAAGKYVDTVRDREAYSYYLAYCERSQSQRPDMRRFPVAFDKFASLSRFSVQTATFAILYGVADVDRLERAKKILVDSVSSGRYVPGTPANRTAGAPSESEAPGGIVRIGSPFFMFFALDALYKTGEHRLAEEAIRRDWGRFSALGINNCPETFCKGNEADFRSVAHGWSASPAYFLPREVLGVKPLSPGYERFTVAPRTDAVTEASGSVATPKGRIYVKWKKGHDGYSVEYKAPDGIGYVSDGDAAASKSRNN